MYKSKPFVYYVKVFKSLSNNIQHYTEWGKYLSKTTISPPIIAPWILMNQIPVVNEWQAPETFGELLVACEKQHINIMCVLQNIVSKIRDGKRHLLLIGFPVPRIFGGDPEIISWKALYLPTVSYGKRTAKGFRNNQQGWWMRDRCEVFTKNAKLDWIVSENWNQHEISQRGKMSDLLLRKRILLIGAGCIGASIAEIFVRAGVYNITIADSDIFEVGNLSRHILNLNNIGEFKELSVCNYLNSLNPHANVKVINDTLSNDDSFKTNIDLDRYDVIVDCTGENNVLDILQRTNFKRTHIIASVSVGLGAKRLYVTLMNGNTFNFNAFYDLISPYLQAEKVLYDDYDLPRNGIGCWHPTFPGRSDDISKCTFYRGIDGLKRILDLAWDQGQYYLGEWHYHPNASSAPSNIDKNQMIVLSQDQKLKCPEPILIIVGGYQDSWNINARLFVNKQEIILNKR